MEEMAFTAGGWSPRPCRRCRRPRPSSAPRRTGRGQHFPAAIWPAVDGGLILPVPPLRGGPSGSAASQPCVWPRSAVGLVPEAVVVVFDQVWPLEQRGAVAATGLGRSPQQAGNAPQEIATG